MKKIGGDASQGHLSRYITVVRTFIRRNSQALIKLIFDFLTML